MGQSDLKPNHSSSEEEEEEDDEVTSGTDSDEVSDTDSGDKTVLLPKNARISPQSAKKTQPPDPPSSEEEEGEEEEEEESDSDSDSPPKTSAVVDRNVKPISSVPMQSKSLKSDGSKTVSMPPPAKSKRPAPAPAAVEKDAKKPKQITVNGERKKPVALRDPASSEEESSDSETNSDSPSKTSALPNYSIKPISSKPIEREAQNLVSKSAKKSTAKSKQPPSTPDPVTSEKDIKKGRKSTATDDDPKKQLFQRLWSEDDEIAVLQGMIDFKTERNGENPIADPDAFHDFIRKSLHVDFSRTQLMDKIRRLKKKYMNNASKGKKDGKDRHFAKSHEQKAYELSKLIWGDDGSSNSNTRGKEVKKNQSQKNGNSKAAGTPASTSTVTATATGITAGGLLKSNGVDDKDKLKMAVELEKKMDISRFVQYGVRNDSLILSEEIVKAGMELVEGSKRVELEAKWKVLMEQELELYVKRMELLKEQALVVLEAIKSSGN